MARLIYLCTQRSHFGGSNGSRWRRDANANHHQGHSALTERFGTVIKRSAFFDCSKSASRSIVLALERFEKTRRKRGWTQAEMAEKSGIDRSFLADVERGKRNISILNLELIADGLRLTLSQLLS